MIEVLEVFSVTHGSTKRDIVISTKGYMDEKIVKLVLKWPPQIEKIINLWFQLYKEWLLSYKGNSHPIEKLDKEDIQIASMDIKIYSTSLVIRKDAN